MGTHSDVPALACTAQQVWTLGRASTAASSRLYEPASDVAVGKTIVALATFAAREEAPRLVVGRRDGIISIVDSASLEELATVSTGGGDVRNLYVYYHSADGSPRLVSGGKAAALWGTT
jgi:hypothetical protein